MIIEMKITNLFTDQETVTRIQTRLPELFYFAELESSRAGKVGMEVGSARERILIALLIYKFGKENVETNIPITQPRSRCECIWRAYIYKNNDWQKIRKCKINLDSRCGKGFEI
jgi:hypothetical protein